MSQQFETDLFTNQQVAVGATLKGTAITLASQVASGVVLDAIVTLFISPVQTTTPGSAVSANPPARVVVQVCPDASNDAIWSDWAAISTNSTAAVTTTLNGAVTAGATTATLTGSGTFNSTSSVIYFADSTTSGEWVYAQGQSGTTLTVTSPGIVNSHSNGISLYNQGIVKPISVTCSGVKRIRVLVDNAQQATGPTLAVYAKIAGIAA